MPLTLVEVCDKLKDVDEITLLERLEINSEDLVSRFIDVIEYRYEELAEELDDPSEE